MSGRKWIVRGVVYGIVGIAVAGAVLYQRWTNPGAVREQVIAAVGLAFPGAQVSVDSARLRILGGIQLTGLRLSRSDDPEKHEFLHVPSAIFYHDKEKILDGQLLLRKIELFRPRLRVRRDREGKWNLHDLTRKPSAPPDTPAPAIVIHQGTLILEDRIDPDKASTLEINDISLTLINDPVAQVALRGGGNSDLLGKLSLNGSIDRRTGEAFLAFKAAKIPLTQNLAARLPLQCPHDLFVGLQFSASANVQGTFSYNPGQQQRIYYDVHCEISEGKLQHPKLPLALENIQAKAQCQNGELRVEKLTARSGATEIEASGVGHLPCVDQEFEVQLELKHVMLGKDLSDRLPPKLRTLHEAFQPKGPMTIRVECARHEGQWVSLATGRPSQVSLRPESISMRFVGTPGPGRPSFPYPLEKVRGDLDYNLDNSHVKFRFDAYAGNEPVLMFGRWNGEGPNADIKFDIIADNVAIDEDLLNSLPPVLQKFCRSFNALGKVDVKSHIRHEPGSAWRNEYHIRIHDAAIKWDQFPYPLHDVSGNIDVYPDHWEFHEFQGKHQGGHVLLNGKSIPKIDSRKEQSYGISLEITGRNVPLDDQLRDALRPMPGLHKAWETFKPQGNLYFTASVNRPTPDVKDLEIHVDARGSSVKPNFLPYLIEDISGQFHFQRHNLEITKLRAKHGETTIALDRGSVDIDTRGGYYADLADLQLGSFRLDDDFVRALPPGKLPAAVKSLQLKDPLRVATRLVIAQAPETGKSPDVYWDGKAWMYGADLNVGLGFKNVTGEVACIGRFNGQMVGLDGNLLVDQVTLFEQPFKKVHAKFVMRDTSPDVMLVSVRAPIFGGDVVGQMRVDLNSALRYEANLTASQINLAEFGRHNLGPKSQLTGAASGRLTLHGFGQGLDTIEGNGSIDIPHGHLYNLPFLLDLLKFLGLHWPDRTAFEEFHTTFGIQGTKVNVQKLDLLGSAVSLSGKGEFDLLSKKVNLDVYPMWGRIEQLLPPQIRPVPTTLSKNLLIVEVRGNVTGNPKDVRYHMKPVPVVIDPLLLMRDRMLGRSSTVVPGARNTGIDLTLPRLMEGDRRYSVDE